MSGDRDQASTTETLRAASDEAFLGAWTEVVGQAPSCLLERGDMIEILKVTEGDEAVERAAEILLDQADQPG